MSSESDFSSDLSQPFVVQNRKVGLKLTLLDLDIFMKKKSYQNFLHSADDGGSGQLHFAGGHDFRSGPSHCHLSIQVN